MTIVRLADRHLRRGRASGDASGLQADLDCGGSDCDHQDAEVRLYALRSVDWLAGQVVKAGPW